MTIKELLDKIKQESLPEDTEIDFECSVDGFTTLDCECDMICTKIKHKYVYGEVTKEKPRLCFELRDKMYAPDKN